MRQVFVYHDEEDTKFAIEFRDFFKAMVKRGKLLISDCTEVTGEKEWLKNKVDKAEIVVLLVTSNLLKRDFFYDDFTPVVLEKRNKGTCVVVPVIFSKSLFKDTKFGKLAPIPSKGMPIDKYPTPEDGFLDVAEQLEFLLENYEESLTAQGLEVENIKPALASFNFYTQLTPPAPPAEPFTVLVLKGRHRSGHDLLAWRWRSTMLPPDLNPRIETISLTSASVTLENNVQIEHEAWKVFNEGKPYEGEESKLGSDLARLLLNILKTEAIVIRFDHFSPILQAEAVNDFFHTLQKALIEAKAKETPLPTLKPLLFHLFHRFDDIETGCSLDFPTQVLLPPIDHVPQADFERWLKENLSGQSNQILYDCIDFERTTILDPMDTTKNEVMDVLERICTAVYAKEPLYDEYIAKLK
jgi:hypothetical protein